jgi:glutamate racemase
VLHDRGLARAGTSPRPRHRVRATGDPAVFAELGRRFLGPEIGSVETTPDGAAVGGSASGGGAPGGDVSDEAVPDEALTT